MFRIRVDTGGTFTDCWGLAPGDDSPRQLKVLSSGRLRISTSDWSEGNSLVLDIPSEWTTPDEFFVGFRVRDASITAFDAKSRRATLSEPIAPSETIDLFTGEEAPILGARLLTGTALGAPFPPLDFRLATTRGTNALLERKGARVAFFTTKGFGDLLRIRDQRRPDLFALQHHLPAPLAATVIEVEERLDADGNVLAGLQIDKASLAGIDTDVAAVALLHSWKNPAHEDVLRETLSNAGFDHVSISSELAPLSRILPRAETAVANAYLAPVMQGFLDGIHTSIGSESDILTMTSAGGLEPIASYCPKDSLLSGPAGGVSGAAAIAEELGHEKILTFDMGGTSTDVARYDDGFQYRFEQKVGDARLLSPTLKIETVASGGGSICRWKNGRLEVGPESAGADPGPACYGAGGPLTITDVNLLLERIDPGNFGIPLTEASLAAARDAAIDLQRQAGATSDGLDHSFLLGLLEISTEAMADAIRTISIRDGSDPTDYALLAFGGAGPLHACEIANRLEIDTIIIPAEAGLLSAYGLDRASIERFTERQINLPVDDPAISVVLTDLETEALALLHSTGYDGAITRRIAELRLTGQDATLTIEVADVESLNESFHQIYRKTFGYDPPFHQVVELVSLRIIAGTGRDIGKRPDQTGSGHSPNPVDSRFIDRDTLPEGSRVEGPIVIQDSFSTLFLKSKWSAVKMPNGALVLSRSQLKDEASRERPSQIVRELFRHRFDNLVAEMGSMLQRSAISTNVKERADYSCALLDSDGMLISSAPHIPVHLGALGLCVRMVRDEIEMRQGDTIVTNHPGVGGSHLPDVTLITPVFAGPGPPVAYIANRAHHAEIGGITPGSMPPAAVNLAEEGVVISPMYLVAEGVSRFDEITKVLTEAAHPTRRLSDNLADLNAQLASNLRGKEILEKLLTTHGASALEEQFHYTKATSSDALADHLATMAPSPAAAAEELDDGTRIAVVVSRRENLLTVDFTGTTVSHRGNLNATPAIVQSAVLYALRLWIQRDIPLNEGLLRDVRIELPECFLNPRFDSDPERCPAVVGGNVETSQRIVDTLLKVFQIEACSQGTMNNLLFGDESFGYYETICGGSGAGPGYDGTAAIHTHMTNTAITDPEILEQRYPVRLHEFSIREGTGGGGRWKGGDGIIREIEFLKPLEISLLTQHRKSGPYGLAGGGDGRPGVQYLNGIELPGITTFSAKRGDKLRLESPGGGGYGNPT